MPDLAARKLPTQARARATVEAIIEGCARVLRHDGYARTSTNRIADAAGVAIGSLYEYFPNRDAIVYQLALRRLTVLREEIRLSVEGDRALEEAPAAGELLRRVFETVARDGALFRSVLLDTPDLQGPELRALMAEIAALVAEGADRAGTGVDLHDAPSDLWLLTRMLSHAVLEIVAGDARRGELSTERLLDSLVRLTQRMLAVR